MSNFAETVTDFLIPQNVRRYWTFKNATTVAVFATIVSALVGAFVRFRPEQVARFEYRSAFHSPLFLSLYYLFVAAILWVIYASRNRASWYLWRVWVFGMTLAGALIGLVDIILPLRTF
jgi:hypothetical protein